MELPVLYKMDSVQTDYSCPICIESLKNPIMLPGCGHNVCTECLNDLHKAKGSESRISCPQCRMKSDVPSSDIKNLPKNIQLEIALQKLNVSKSACQQQLETENCKDHQQPLILICMEHNELCCIICAQFGDHQGHAIKDLKNAKQEVQQALKQVYDQNCNKKKQAEELIQRYDQLGSDVKMYMDSHVLQVNNAYQKLVQKIQELQKQRVQETTKKFEEFNSYLDQQQEQFKPLLLNFENLVDPNIDILTQIKYKEDLIKINELKIQDPKNMEIVLVSNTNVDHIFQKMQDFGQIKTLKVGHGKSLVILDEKKKSTNIKISKGGLKLQKTLDGEFNTVLATDPFFPGKVYTWYVKVITGTYFKIGVSKDYSDYEHAFSDFENGWGWFTHSAALRHNSNGSGQSYGQKCELNDIIGITFDTINGTLSFSRNGTNLGVAFTEQQFKIEEFFAAFSCLHNSDCLELVDQEGNQLSSSQQPSGLLFAWDPEQSYSECQFAEDRKKVTFQGCSTYRTAMAGPALEGGKIYKWKVQLLQEHDYKIGVSKMYNQYDHAFSDYNTGWAFFNRDSALRHNSNGSGPSYGSRVNPPGVIEIICDTKNGNLKFILDGRDYGNAYSNIQEMCDGNLYPAIACLSNGGSVIITETSVEVA